MTMHFFFFLQCITFIYTVNYIGRKLPGNFKKCNVPDKKAYQHFKYKPMKTYTNIYGIKFSLLSGILSCLPI